jgi:hypothetical protein
MYRFTSNPPARQIAPTPACRPSERYVYRSEARLRLGDLERFCRDRRLAPSAVGRAIADDPRLIADLRDGRQPRRQMLDKIDAFLARQGVR